MRVEYHWARYLSRANPNLPDVCTAELRVRRPDGDWLYLLARQARLPARAPCPAAIVTSSNSETAVRAKRLERSPGCARHPS